MLFEIHDIILHRLWKAARRTARKTPVMSRSWVRKVKWANLTERWYMNHQRKIPDGMVAYVRVFNGLPW